MRRRGAVEWGTRHYPAAVLIHVVFSVVLVGGGDVVSAADAAMVAGAFGHFLVGARFAILGLEKFRPLLEHPRSGCPWHASDPARPVPVGAPSELFDGGVGNDLASAHFRRLVYGLGTYGDQCGFFAMRSHPGGKCGVSACGSFDDAQLHQVGEVNLPRDEQLMIFLIPPDRLFRGPVVKAVDRAVVIMAGL